MRRLLQLALALTLSTGAATHAQITNPDNLVAPPPHNPAHTRPLTDDNLQWLWPFTQPAPTGRASDLRLDARFQALLARDFNHPQAIWGDTPTRPSLDQVIPLFLSAHGTVTAEQNRYLAIDGCVPSFCPAHGLLWIDLGSPHPLIVFAAVNWTTQNHTTAEPNADYNLYLFANRALPTLPLALTASIAHWDARLAEAHRTVPHIAQTVLIDPDGTPHDLDPQQTGANTIAPQPVTNEAANK